MNPIKFPGSKTIDSFKRELNLLITNSIAKFKDSHKIGDLVVVSQTYLPEPDTIDFAAGLGPMFLKLPREIRDIIFGRLLASGHTEFLRASKILSKEGTSLISKHSIYRTNIAFNSKANCPKLSQPVVDTVQNLHLRVNMRDYPFFGLGTFPEKRILEMFGNRYLCRKTCSVSLENRYSTESMIPLDVLNFSQTFGEFEDVTLSIETDWFGGSPFPDHLFEWQMRLMDTARHESFDDARECLEPVLGTAYRVEQNEGVQMVFHPRCSGQGNVRDISGEKRCMWEEWKEEESWVP